MQRQIAPDKVGAALAEAFGIGGAPAPGEAPCPAICAAVATCMSALDTLCDLTNGAICLSTSACPVPAFCASCQPEASAAPAPGAM